MDKILSDVGDAFLFSLGWVLITSTLTLIALILLNNMSINTLILIIILILILLILVRVKIISNRVDKAADLIRLIIETKL